MSQPYWDGGTPYAGPPASGPAPQQPWGVPPPYGYPPPGWGWPPPPQPPQPPQRPGSVIAAAVLAFGSAVLVLVGTLYALAFSALLSLARGPGAGLGPGTALVHLLLAGLLVVAGVRVLAGDRRWLLGAAAVQLVFCVYWAVALTDVAAAPFADGVVVLPLFYGVLAGLAAGLTWLPDARAWAAHRGARPAGG